MSEDSFIHSFIEHVPDLFFILYCILLFGLTEGHAVCWLPGLGIKPPTPAVEVQSLSHWTAREVSDLIYFTLILHTKTATSLFCTLHERVHLIARGSPHEPEGLVSPLDLPPAKLFKILESYSVQTSSKPGSFFQSLKGKKKKKVEFSNNFLGSLQLSLLAPSPRLTLRAALLCTLEVRCRCRSCFNQRKE